MKKRIISILLAVCLIIPGLPVNAFASSVLYGDVNSDSEINMRDVLAMKRYIADHGYGINKTAADVTCDGSIDANDLVLLKKYIAGWDVLLGPPFYTVSFNSNGGSSIDPIKVRQSELLEKVPSPAKDNAIFLGWYTDSGLTKQFYAEDSILSDLTLYAKYAKTENQEQFADNTFTLTEQKPELSFKIASTDLSKDAKAVLEGITLENIGNSEYISLNATGSNGDFTVSADGGFKKGAAYKLTLDDDSLAFADKGPSYRICTFMIAKEEVIDVSLNRDLIYIKSSELSDIISNGQAVDTLFSAVLGNTDTDVSGSFRYAGAGSLQTGDALCVYENVKPTDRDTTTDYSSDTIAYVEVTGIDGTTVSFKSADAEEVLALPDTLPISESELTAYDANGSFSANTSRLDFAKYTELGLDAETTVDKDDYLVITETDNDIVYGKVVNVIANGGSIAVSFTVTTADAIEGAALDYYTKTDADGNMLLKNADVPKLEKQIEAQTVQSGFANSALNYLAYAATQTDGFKKVSGVEDFVMTTSDGKAVNPADISLKQLGIGYEGENITVEAQIDNHTEHFNKGLRIAVKVSGTISIDAGEENEVVIDLSASFVEEVRMSFNADGGAVWKFWKGFIPYISDYKMNANIDVYDYTGVSVSAKVSLQEQDDGSIDISDELEKLMGSKDEDEITAGVQNLFEAYGDMLENDTDYVTLFDKALVEQKAWVDPLCIIAYSFKMDFVVNANLNLALGCNLEYMSGTRYNFWFAIKAKSAGNSSMDLIDETFGFQFYVMGHLGLRAGLKFEFAVGLFSTDLASVGIVSEVGAYVELFGYFFYEYDSVRAQGSSQSETSSKMCGALYLEFGIYLEISFKAQAFNDKYTYNPTLYENQWPLLYAGDQINVYDFGYEQPKEDDVVLIKDVTSDTLPDSIRYMDCLDLKEGDLSVNEYGLNRFYYSLTNKYFALDAATGIVTVTVPEDVRYMECDLTVTWKTAKLAFSKGDITRTIHLVWTNLTDTELKEKYDVSVKVGKNIVWSTRVNRGETPVLPTEQEILDIIGYNKYVVNGTNLKYTGYTGYGNQTALPATGKQSYTFGVTEKDYTLTINGVQNKDGTTVSKTFSAKFGENFDLSALAATGTGIAGKTYTRYLKTDCSSESGKPVTDRIDTVFATQLLNGTCSYTAKYADNSCKVTYLFNTFDGKSLSSVTEKIEKGSVPAFDYSEYLLNQDGGYMVKEWDKTIGKVSTDATFTALCSLPTGEKHTITYNTNGGSSINSVQRYEGSALTAPAEPTRKGYTFTGWYTDEQLTNIYTFGKMPANNFTLYADWTANTYTITFDANGGECATNTATVTYGSPYDTLPNVIQPGFAFAGWYTAAAGGEKVESTDTVLTAGNQILYAHWAEKAAVTGVDTGVQTTIYNKNVQTFKIKGTALDGFTIKYKKAGDADWGDNAVNAGAYAVMITRPEDANYKAYEKTLTDAFVIKKASRTISAPAGATTVFRTISVTPVVDFEGYGDGAVKYAVNTSPVLPTSGWTTSRSIVNLNANTNYYVFSMVTEGDNYLSAACTETAQMTTGSGENAVGSQPIYFAGYYIGNYVSYAGAVKTSDISKAGTDNKNILLKFLYRDGTSGNGMELSSESDMERDSSHDFTVLDQRDPWSISGISLVDQGNGSAPGWHGEYVDIKPYSGASAARINVNRWFEDNYGTYVDFATDAFKRTISAVGDFNSWGGDYITNSSSQDKIEYTYNGKVSDQYGTDYNVFAHDDAPQLNVAPSKEGYYDCFTYSIDKFTVDKAALYQKMLARGDDQITFTITLKFDSRSTNNTEFTKTVTISRQ